MSKGAFPKKSVLSQLQASSKSSTKLWKPLKRLPASHPHIHTYIQKKNKKRATKIKKKELFTMSKYTTFHIEAERPISESSLEKKRKREGRIASTTSHEVLQFALALVGHVFSC